mmetsp:Transcript_19124/g.36592  ORF Transcript_19124/g.36592 Transcript_19124/m.36592 type:complete len:267 (-) Transcript_19124:161-961(-)
MRVCLAWYFPSRRPERCVRLSLVGIFCRKDTTIQARPRRAARRSRGSCHCERWISTERTAAASSAACSCPPRAWTSCPANAPPRAEAPPRARRCVRGTCTRRWWGRVRLLPRTARRSAASWGASPKTRRALPSHGSRREWRIYRRCTSSRRWRRASRRKLLGTAANVWYRWGGRLGPQCLLGRARCLAQNCLQPTSSPICLLQRTLRKCLWRKPRPSLPHPSPWVGSRSKQTQNARSAWLFSIFTLKIRVLLRNTSHTDNTMQSSL